jgi:hypothetical protein
MGILRLWSGYRWREIAFGEGAAKFWIQSGVELHANYGLKYWPDLSRFAGVRQAPPRTQRVNGFASRSRM